MSVSARSGSGETSYPPCVPPGRLLVLAHQATYRCRHSGACCTAGWHIPVEPDRTNAIRAQFGEVLNERGSILRTTPARTCVLFEPARPDRPSHCALQRMCGHEALPSACRHFPRIFLRDAYATRVTLSHFCPTAASLLFEPSEVKIVEASLDLARPDDREGLDARHALPPLLHPRMLMDVESYAAWEGAAIDLLASSPEPALAIARLASVTERIREWEPPDSLLAMVRSAFQEAAQQTFAHDAIRAGQMELPSTWRDDFQVARAAVPSGLSVPDVPESLDDAHTRFVAATWGTFSDVICRYLAGRLFGSWVAYQGRGLRTVVASLSCALSVLRVEGIRAAQSAGRVLDAELLRTAVRQADLLLVHKADRQALAEELSRVEGRTRC
jgi:hypothetical protein